MDTRHAQVNHFKGNYQFSNNYLVCRQSNRKLHQPQILVTTPAIIEIILRIQRGVSSFHVQTSNPYKVKRIVKDYLLVIGPMPPPVAGTSVSFQLFCNYVSSQYDASAIRVINSSPKKPDDRPLIHPGNVVTASRVIWGCLRNIKNSRKVLLFGSNQFLISLMPICLCLAKLAGKPFYVRCFGGSFDSYYFGTSPIVRTYMRWVFDNLDGLIVQTDSLKKNFLPIMPGKVHKIPGYRNMINSQSHINRKKDNKNHLQLVYVGHIREEKGIFYLLEALRVLNLSGERKNKSVTVKCDFYGAIYQNSEERFSREITGLSGAAYKGIITPDQVIPTLTKYDAFVFPTFYSGEGHPGVLVEALIAGLPIITTEFKSIPDIVKHEETGILIKPESTSAIVDAVNRLCANQELRERLGDNALQHREKYSVSSVVPKLLEVIQEPAKFN